MFSVKDAWRRALKERLGVWSKDQIADFSAAICERIVLSPYWEKSEVMALYASLPSEPSLQALLEKGKQTGKRFLFPRVEEASVALTFHEVQAWSELQVGRWGILEPSVNRHPCSKIEEIDLICVPGLGFDRRGARLGRGKGFYDQFLARLSPDVMKLGVFFSGQELNEIPEMSFDIRMNGIVTERELILL